MILSCNRPQIRLKAYHEREAEKLGNQRRDRDFMIQETINFFRNIKIIWR